MVANLPAEIISHILHFCHPVDYAHFLMATPLVHYDEKQCTEKKAELHRLIADFNAQNIEHIIYTIIDDLYPMELRDHLQVYEFFSTNLELFAQANPDLVHNEYLAFRRRGEVYKFPTRHQLGLFLRFCHFERNGLEEIERVLSNYNTQSLWMKLHY